MSDSYVITATITVQVTNPSAVRAIAAVSGAGVSGDERADLEAAVGAGLKELPGLVQRYGFQVVDSHAVVAAKSA